MKIKKGMENNYQAMAEEMKKDLMLGAALRYLERWADMMETAAAEGMDIGSAAERTLHTADTEGITGYMYGISVAVLADVWEYGEELRVWHNKEYGYEGKGVANSSILVTDDRQQPDADESCEEER